MKPMLAGTLKDSTKIKFPILVQPKLDGIRAMVVDGKLLSRSLKPIPNAAVRALLEKPEYEGLDGELIVGSPTADDCYRKTVSFVMSDDKQDTGDLRYYVFDLWNSKATYKQRKELVRMTQMDYPLLGLSTVSAQDQYGLDALEASFVGRGYEGAILRSPDGLYKFGRGTASKMDLIKLKRFRDSEAIVVGVEEEMHNANVAFKNELGRTARSSEKAGKVGKGRLGALIVQKLDTDVVFKIGTGFSAADREVLWGNTGGLALIGKIAKYKYFPVGEKDKPRHPVFLGWRDARDMS